MKNTTIQFTVKVKKGVRFADGKVTKRITKSTNHRADTVYQGLKDWLERMD